MPDQPRLLIDGHLDLAMNALYLDRDLRKPVYVIREEEIGKTGSGYSRGTVTYPELRKANIGISFVTVIARTNPDADAASEIDFATREVTYAQAHGQLAYYQVHQRMGDLTIIKDRKGLAAHLAAWESYPDATPLGVVLTMEGADPIVNVDELEGWYEDGLRILSLAHYGPSAWAYGTHSDGGLKEGAVDLLHAMSRLGVGLDVTHLCDRSFAEALDAFQGIVVATHSNCRTLVPHERQFTDEQLKELISRDGVIGTVLDAWMLQPGWVKGESVPEVTLEALIDNIDHICQLAGNADHAAIGSDLDGGYGTEQTPTDLDTIFDLQRVPEMLAKRGYGDGNIDAIMHGNWLRLLERLLPED